jgi:hypothetical protein
VLRLPPLVTQSSDDVARAVGPTLQRYLSGDLASSSIRDEQLTGDDYWGNRG